MAILLLVTISIAVSTPSAQAQPPTNWAKRLDSGHGPEAITNLQFYFHDIVSGRNPTAVQIIKPASGSSGFGQVNVADEPLTVGPDASSKVVGRAQGMYGVASQSMTDMALLMVLSYGFTDGPYKGSSLSIVGRNPVMSPTRELPVLGGTGVFRMARGYALMKTVSVNAAGDAVVHYNVTVYTPASNGNNGPTSPSSTAAGGGGSTRTSSSSSSSPATMAGRQGWLVSFVVACAAFICLLL
ncbi:unnamed protein product [Linum tenue]|uniref:Dirigent protein n=1 Tax=Linum tenue TaxID=586396 RepID=A0AAV0PDE2_9ROSI|nr:unnamed protein product [Linum tenue]